MQQDSRGRGDECHERRRKVSCWMRRPCVGIFGQSHAWLGQHGLLQSGKPSSKINMFGHVIVQQLWYFCMVAHLFRMCFPAASATYNNTNSMEPCCMKPCSACRVLCSCHATTVCLDTVFCAGLQHLGIINLVVPFAVPAAPAAAAVLLSMLSLLLLLCLLPWVARGLCLPCCPCCPCCFCCLCRHGCPRCPCCACCPREHISGLGVLKAGILVAWVF